MYCMNFNELTLDDILEIHEIIVEEYGVAKGHINIGVVESLKKFNIWIMMIFIREQHCF